MRTVGMRISGRDKLWFAVLAVVLVARAVVGFARSDEEIVPVRDAAAGEVRVPVLLVPGWSQDEDDLIEMAERFREAGWPEGAVESVSFGDRFGSNVEHAAELGRRAAELLERTGADSLDVVAHSMGGLATRWWLAHPEAVGGAAVAAAVRRVVFLGTPHRGTLMSSVAWGEGGREMEPGSPFLLELSRYPGVPEGVEALTVRTETDLQIEPDSSATLPGVPDLELCCPSHAGLVDDSEVFGVVAEFLTR